MVGLTFLGFFFLFHHSLVHPLLIGRLQKTIKTFILGQQADEIILAVWSPLTSHREIFLKHHVWANQDVFHSKVAAIHGLIIAPAAASQIGSGNMAFSLAAMGGFNYISKEIEPYPDEPFGFFSMVKDDLDIIGDYDIKEKVESQALHFMFELRQFKKRSEERGHRHWFIFIMGTIKTAKCQMHLWRLATDKEKKMQYHVTRLIKDSNGENVDREYGSLVVKEDEKVLISIFQEINERLKVRKVAVRGNDQNIVSELDNTDRWKSINDSNVMVRMGGGIDCNAFSLRIADEILVYCNTHLLIAKDIADTIRKHIEPEHTIPEDAMKCFMKEGDGFADDFGKEEVFKKSPKELKEMIETENKKALQEFEHLDLDGNEQADYAERHQPSGIKRLFKRK